MMIVSLLVSNLAFLVFFFFHKMRWYQFKIAVNCLRQQQKSIEKLASYIEWVSPRITNNQKRSARRDVPREISIIADCLLLLQNTQKETNNKCMPLLQQSKMREKNGNNNITCCAPFPRIYRACAKYTHLVIWVILPKCRQIILFYFLVQKEW